MKRTKSKTRSDGLPNIQLALNTYEETLFLIQRLASKVGQQAALPKTIE